jgi:hypothetical protein
MTPLKVHYKHGPHVNTGAQTQSNDTSLKPVTTFQIYLHIGYVRFEVFMAVSVVVVVMVLMMMMMMVTTTTMMMF